MSAEGPLRNREQAGFELIETLRWEPGTGFLRLDRHLARLYASARALGFSAAHDRIGLALQEAVGGGAPLRVRLALSRDGVAQCLAQPYEAAPDHAVWRLAVAATRIASGDPLIRHKTTRRAVYEAARAEFSRETADEVLLLNERGEVCEGTIANLFIDLGGGKLVTPALSCGLLPGVLRVEMIETRKAEEAVVTLAGLRSARAIFVGNSLRGLIEASLD